MSMFEPSSIAASDVDVADTNNGSPPQSTDYLTVPSDGSVNHPRRPHRPASDSMLSASISNQTHPSMGASHPHVVGHRASKPESLNKVATKNRTKERLSLQPGRENLRQLYVSQLPKPTLHREDATVGQHVNDKGESKVRATSLYASLPSFTVDGGAEETLVGSIANLFPTTPLKTPPGSQDSNSSDFGSITPSTSPSKQPSNDSDFFSRPHQIQTEISSPDSFAYRMLKHSLETQVETIQEIDEQIRTPLLPLIPPGWGTQLSPISDHTEPSPRDQPPLRFRGRYPRRGRVSDRDGSPRARTTSYSLIPNLSPIHISQGDMRPEVIEDGELDRRKSVPLTAQFYESRSQNHLAESSTAGAKRSSIQKSDQSRRVEKYDVGPKVRFSKDAHEVIMGTPKSTRKVVLGAESVAALPTTEEGESRPRKKEPHPIFRTTTMISARPMPASTTKPSIGSRIADRLARPTMSTLAREAAARERRGRNGGVVEKAKASSFVKAAVQKQDKEHNAPTPVAEGLGAPSASGSPSSVPAVVVSSTITANADDTNGPSPSPASVVGSILTVNADDANIISSSATPESQGDAIDVMLKSAEESLDAITAQCREAPLTVEMRREVANIVKMLGNSIIKTREMRILVEDEMLRQQQYLNSRLEAIANILAGNINSSQPAASGN